MNNENSLKLLWECCQIPDFVKKAYGNHLEVVSKVFNFLNSDEGKVSNFYMKKQLSTLDKLDGNVDSISNRIANVRTWSYVANKPYWVENQDYWIERTKLLEDKLSDRLHEELTKSFIDKRASVLAKGLKQDIELITKIDENKVNINGQYIGELKGLKIEYDLKVGTLETDLKSLRKASRQSVGPEFSKRISEIISTGILELKDDFKIYWNKFAIAKLYAGKSYLEPEILLIVDDIIEQKEKEKLNNFLDIWIKEKINILLKSLIDLKNIKQNNSNIRALAYQLYENNGVLKRDNVISFLKDVKNDERKILRNLGVRFGRYHIFLHQLFKPEAVSLRILLWKNFHQNFYNLQPPKFGLNFFEIKEKVNKKFMLLCGFENFDKYYVRIDILERLFMIIIQKSPENSEIKVVPEMLNLLGCNKESFIKLLKSMNYKTFEKENDIYFKYLHFKGKKQQYKKNYGKNDNPFNVLKDINFK